MCALLLLEFIAVVGVARCVTCIQNYYHQSTAIHLPLPPHHRSPFGVVEKCSKHNSTIVLYTNENVLLNDTPQLIKYSSTCPFPHTPTQNKSLSPSEYSRAKERAREGAGKTNTTDWHLSKTSSRNEMKRTVSDHPPTQCVQLGSWVSVCLPLIIYILEKQQGRK